MVHDLLEGERRDCGHMPPTSTALEPKFSWQLGLMSWTNLEPWKANGATTNWGKRESLYGLTPGLFSGEKAMRSRFCVHGLRSIIDYSYVEVVSQGLRHQSDAFQGTFWCADEDSCRRYNLGSTWIACKEANHHISRICTSLLQLMPSDACCCNSRWKMIEGVSTALHRSTSSSLGSILMPAACLVKSGKRILIASSYWNICMSRSIRLGSIDWHANISRLKHEW